MKRIHYNIYTVVIAAVCMLACSCAEREMEIQTPVELPAQFKVILDDYGMSRSAQQWPDRACIMVFDASSETVYGFLTYSALNNKWTFSFSRNVELPKGSGKPCNLFYVKDFSIADYSNYPRYTIRTSADRAAYSGTGNYIYDGLSFSISGNLNPRTGRIRLRGDLSSVAAYSYRYIYHNPNSSYTGCLRSYVNWDITQTEEEGYSPYLYFYYIPKFRNGDILYKYKGDALLQEGMSYVIEAPTGTESNNTWEVDRILFKESYKSVRVSPGQPYTMIKEPFESQSGFIMLFFMQFMPSDGSNSLSYTAEKSDAFRMILKRADGATQIYNYSGTIYKPSKTMGYYIDEYYTLNDTDIAEIYFESDYDIVLTISDFTLERQ